MHKTIYYYYYYYYYYFYYLLRGRPNRPHYRSITSIRPSVRPSVFVLYLCNIERNCRSGRLHVYRLVWWQ